jgi:hypothetical protein
MSRRLIALNVLIGLVVVGLAALLVREVAARRSLPAASARQATTASAPGEPAAASVPARSGDSIGAYGVIASRNLFSPTRSEAPPPPPAAPAAPPAPKPILHGVIVDEAKSRAWLEDPATKRTYGYTIGDAVGGGRLERIVADRVVIARPEGAVEVLLRDPSKPRPAPTPAATPTPARPQARTTAPGVAPGAPVPVPTPGAPGDNPAAVAPQAPGQQPPAPQQFQRRPSVTPPPGQPGVATPPDQPSVAPPPGQSDDD